MKGFIEFIKTQGVLGLAVGFVLGASVTKVVNSLVEDIINPIIGIFIGAAGDLKEAVLVVGPIEIRYGNFLSVLIDFIVISAVVYVVVKLFNIEDVKKVSKVKKK